MPEITGVHHIALTVSDLERSEPWYSDVFHLTRMVTFEEGDGERRKVILRHAPTGLRIGLVTHQSSPGEAFDETRTGLDHLSLAVASLDELEELEQRLERMGAHHSPIAEGIGGALVLVFRDPDNIQLEVVCSPSG